MKAKKILAAILCIAMLSLLAVPVSAEKYWNYDIKFYAAYGTVNINGDGTGWDSAPAIKMTLNGDPMYDRGYLNYQGGWDGDRADSDFSGIFKVMWDENYLYFLEDRNDDKVNLNGDAEQPYFTDGTLVFTQVDSADGKMNPDGVSVHAFYTVGNGSGAIGGDLRARVCNMEEGSREVIEIPGSKIASTLKAGGFIIEVAIPWSFYSSLVPNFKAPAAGDILGWSYVVHDSDEDDPGFEKQFCYAVDNDNLGDVPGGYDFGGWGVVELMAPPAAPIVVESPAAVVEPAGGGAAADAEIAPVIAAVAPTAPSARTGDGTAILIILLAVTLAAGAVVTKKAKSKI